MPLCDLLRSTWNIVRSCRLLWLLTLFEIVYSNVLSPLIPPHASNVLFNLGFACTSLLLGFMAFFPGFGMIYAVERYIAGQPASLNEAWHQFLANFFKLFLASLFWFIPAALVCVFLYFVLHLVLYYGLYYASIHWSTAQRTELVILIVLLVSIFLVSILELSYRAVYLGHLSALRGLWRGWQVFSKNFWRLAIINLASSVIFLLLQVVVSRVYFTAIDPGTIDTLASATVWQRFLIVSSTPPARAVGAVISLFMIPFLSTLLTLIYTTTTATVTSPTLIPQTDNAP